MARFEMRIGLFESHSHFQSIANPPDPKSRRKIQQIYTFRKIEKSQNPGIRRGRRQWAEPLKLYCWVHLVGFLEVHRLLRSGLEIQKAPISARESIEIDILLCFLISFRESRKSPLCRGTVNIKITGKISLLRFRP